MIACLSLHVVTPLQIVLDAPEVLSLRAEDASGDFGILPGHADFLTVIDAGVLRWRTQGAAWRYCALRGGVFTVTGGRAVRVACREAILGEDLALLRARIAETRAEALDTRRRDRTRDTRLHARAIRRLMQELSSGGDTLGLGSEAGL